MYFPTFFSGILSGIYSDILSGILSGIYSDIFCGILPDILSDLALPDLELARTEIWSSQLRNSSAHSS